MVGNWKFHQSRLLTMAQRGHTLICPVRHHSKGIGPYNKILGLAIRLRYVCRRSLLFWHVYGFFLLLFFQGALYRTDVLFLLLFLDSLHGNGGDTLPPSLYWLHSTGDFSLIFSLGALYCNDGPPLLLSLGTLYRNDDLPRFLSLDLLHSTGDDTRASSFLLHLRQSFASPLAVLMF